MKQPIDQATKTKMLEEIKNGSKVIEVAAKYNVSDKTIYHWLKAQSDNTGTSNLQIAKLRRENEELKALVGALTLDAKRSKKNPVRS